MLPFLKKRLVIDTSSEAIRRITRGFLSENIVHNTTIDPKDLCSV